MQKYTVGSDFYFRGFPVSCSGKNRQMHCVHGSEDINGLFIPRGVPQVNANWILVDFLSLFGKVQSPHI